MLSARCSSSGVALFVPLVVDYVGSGLDLVERAARAINHLAVLGSCSMILGFTTFTFALLLLTRVALTRAAKT